ncbi:hypothetical protein GCM10025782_00730 [Pedococcus ginsenosidimutans]|uniref:Mce-associated membrane protein n=1 Tax=Pedococcus ginsenosidimutans TaxID=490570 RepID=A0ABP8XJ79_9MICO
MSSSAETPRPRPRVAGHRARARATEATTGSVRSTAPTVEPTVEPATSAAPLATPGAGTRRSRFRRPAARPGTQPAGEVGAPAVAADASPARAGHRRWAVPLVALVASLALLGTVLGVSLRDTGEEAAVERAASSQARTSIEQMLSYNYKTIDAQSAQIEGLLTGAFKGEFTTAMDKQIKPLAVKNQTVVQARVSDIGVMSSTPTTVKVMAFVNQARVGSDQKDPVVDQNRVLATMSKVGNRWLISRVDAF